MRYPSRIIRPLVIASLVALTAAGCSWVKPASVASDGSTTNNPSFNPSISADGRYVAFNSYASNLVTGDTNGWPDVFVRDLRSGITTRVSVDSAGNQANAWSDEPVISGDGRYVAFVSQATNLVTGDTNGFDDAFLHDMVTGTTTRIGISSAGAQGNGDSAPTGISSDGRYVALQSDATNLVAGDTNGASDAFVRDTVAGTTTRVSLDGSGGQGNDYSGSAVITPDGRYVAFESLATNLVPGDTNDVVDVFVRDTVGGTTTRIDVGDHGQQGDNFGTRPAISADGRYVAFDSVATNMVADDTNGHEDIFVRDTAAGTTTRVDIATDGTQADADSRYPSISADGRYVAFSSSARSLGATDPVDFNAEVFVRDTVTGTTTGVSSSPAGNPRAGDHPTISADGRYIAFEARDVVVRHNPQPFVTGVAPSAIAAGATTDVTISGSGFIPGELVVVDGPGSTTSNVHVESAHEITASVTIPADAPLGTRNLWVELPGTGPGVAAGGLAFCSACITVH